MFVFDVSVPAKAVEIYLDLRRLIEEQVRVSVMFSLLSSYLSVFPSVLVLWSLF